MIVNDMIENFLSLYGDGSEGTCPTGAQWRRVLERDPDKPLALINFFKFRDTAVYSDSAVSKESVSGDVAFQRYADVSIPTMQRIGGEFLLVAPFAGSFLGTDQDWDLVAIGGYPNLRAFLDLYQDEVYLEAFRHRSAAVERQNVLITER